VFTAHIKIFQKVLQAKKINNQRLVVMGTAPITPLIFQDIINSCEILSKSKYI